jgi:prophage DNA circulation protein
MATLIGGGAVAAADQSYRRPAASGIAKGSCKSSSTSADNMTFILAIERKHRVLRAKATGIIASQDLVDLDNASIAILSRDEAVEGAPYRGLYDFSELAAVPQTTAAARGSTASENRMLTCEPNSLKNDYQGSV